MYPFQVRVVQFATDKPKYMYICVRVGRLSHVENCEKWQSERLGYCCIKKDFDLQSGL